MMTAPVSIALLLFVLINVAMAVGSGVRSGGDTGMYVDGAAALLEGQALSVRQPSYAAFIAIIAFFQGIGAGLTGVVVAQLIAAAAAAAVVARMAIELSGPLAAAIAVTLFAVDFDTNRWHAFILSDSFYLSALTIAVWCGYRAHGERMRPSRIASAIGVMLVSALIRPEGWFLFPAAAWFWIAGARITPARRWVTMLGMVAGAGLLLAAVAPRLSGNLTAVGPVEMLQRGQTIWSFEGWRVTMPADPAFSDGHASAGDAIAYAFRHPISTATLMAARAGVHFAHVRPYFSFPHNAVIAVWLTPIYVLSLVAIWMMRRRAIVQWCVIVIVSQTFVVVLTHADWDGRYLSHVMPLLYPVAGAAAATLAHRRREAPLEEAIA